MQKPTQLFFIFAHAITFVCNKASSSKTSYLLILEIMAKSAKYLQALKISL